MYKRIIVLVLILNYSALWDANSVESASKAINKKKYNTEIQNKLTRLLDKHKLEYETTYKLEFEKDKQYEFYSKYCDKYDYDCKKNAAAKAYVNSGLNAQMDQVYKTCSDIYDLLVVSKFPVQKSRLQYTIDRCNNPYKLEEVIEKNNNLNP